MGELTKKELLDLIEQKITHEGNRLLSYKCSQRELVTVLKNLKSLKNERREIQAILEIDKQKHKNIIHSNQEKPMKTIFIFDTETDGVNPKTDKILELAGILYDVESRSIIQQASTLVYAEYNAAEHINNISVPSLKSVMYDIFFRTVLLMREMIKASDAIVAHNAKFDRDFIREFDNISHNQESLSFNADNKTWICSKEDISWPCCESLKLVDIAKTMKIETGGAHRALADCIMLAHCFSKLPDLKEQLLSISNKEIYRANVSFADKHLAKEAGFYWNHEAKEWWKKMTPEQATDIKFSITKIIN